MLVTLHKTRGLNAHRNDENGEMKRKSRDDIRVRENLHNRVNNV